MRSILERAGQAWRALTPPRRAVLASTVWAVATLPVLSRLVIGRAADDLKVFMNGADAVLHGPLVYRDVVFEYPPYALLWFLPPRALSHDLGSFRLAFGLEMWAADALVKALLLWHGVRHRRGLHDFTPFLAYSLGSAALGHFLLQRFDLVPAALTLGAALAVAGGSALLGGFLVAVGAGTSCTPRFWCPCSACSPCVTGAPGLPDSPGASRWPALLWPSPCSGFRGGALPRITSNAGCRRSRCWPRLSGRCTSPGFPRGGRWCGERWK